MMVDKKVVMMVEQRVSVTAELTAEMMAVQKVLKTVD
jgi:hypothetical protein